MATPISEINHNLTLDSNVDTEYIKSKSYISTSASPGNISDSFNRPRVIQWDPHMGTDKSTISVVLEQSVSDTSLHNEEVRPMKIVFGQLVVETSQQQQRAPSAAPNNLNSQLIWITLVAKVPRFSDTHVELGPQVPLSICVYDSTAKDTAIDHWNFGLFTYNKGTSEETEYSRKRREPDSLSAEIYPSKRSNSIDDDQLFNQLLAPYDDSPEKSTISSPQDSHQQPFIVPQSTTTPQTILNQFNADHQYRQPTLIAPAASPLADHEHQYSNDRHQQHQNQRSYEMQQFPNGSLNEGQGAYGMRDYVHNSNGPISIQPNPSQYNYSLQYASYPPQQTQAGSYLSMGQPNAMAGLNYPSYSQQHHSLTSLQTMRNSSANESHPFAGVLSRANLKITGDLMEMTYNWTPEEWQSGRKLVKFWRRQHSDNTDSSDRTGEVECGFESIEQEVYQQQRLRENMTAQKDGGPKKSNSLIVSCIYWQERNEYFITSVDCIYLLEGLIGVQFTVEEKNRIRRNLEGFRPFTVSKCKPECADFFKLIMSFPHPKPRNIEKDVKVFAWKTLSNALRKIIRKYTPSYSSTVVVNLN